MTRWVALAVFCAITSFSVHALEDSREPLVADSVGRLTAGGDECVATIVAPGIAVTTAHCLHDHEGRRRRPGDLSLIMPNGNRIGVEGVHANPGFAGDAEASLAMIRRDLGCVSLTRAVACAAQALGASPVPGEFLRLYRSDDVEGELCRVLLADSEVFTLECTVDEGSSGAPLFRETPYGAQLVGIVSAMETLADHNGAIAVVLQEHCPSER